MVCRSVPVSTPAAVAQPAARPPAMLWLRINIVLGPGTTTSTATAATNAINCEPSNMCSSSPVPIMAASARRT